jgi:putative transposase
MPPTLPFPLLHTSPKITRPAEMLYSCNPLSFRNVEDLLHERGFAISHERRKAGV